MARADLPAGAIWRYWKSVLLFTVLETRAEIFSRSKEAAVAVLAVLIGAAAGWSAGGWLETLKGGFVAAVAGAVIVFLWNLVTVPPRLRAGLLNLPAGTVDASFMVTPRDAFPRAVVRMSSLHRETQPSTHDRGATQSTTYLLYVTNAGTGGTFYATQETTLNRAQGEQRLCRWNGIIESHVHIASGQRLALIFAEYDSRIAPDGSGATWNLFQPGEGWGHWHRVHASAGPGKEPAQPKDFEVVVQIFAEPDLAEPVVITAKLSGPDIHFTGIAP